MSSRAKTPSAKARAATAADQSDNSSEEDDSDDDHEEEEEKGKSDSSDMEVDLTGITHGGSSSSPPGASRSSSETERSGNSGGGSAKPTAKPAAKEAKSSKIWDDFILDVDANYVTCKHYPTGGVIGSCACAWTRCYHQHASCVLAQGAMFALANSLCVLAGVNQHLLRLYPPRLPQSPRWRWIS